MRNRRRVNISLATFTINPTPSDATVTINGQVRKSITAYVGTKVTWEVKRTDYTTQSGSEILTKDTTKSISLSRTRYTFTINPTPSDSTVTINGQVTRSLVVDSGSTVNWSVSRLDYQSQSGNEVVRSNVNKNITLSILRYTFTINPTPSDSTVTINDQVTKSLVVNSGSVASWVVSKTNYIPNRGSELVRNNITKNITLIPAPVTFTINPIPSDATVTINGEVRRSVTVASGSTVTWSVERYGYRTISSWESVTSTGTKKVTLDTSNVVLHFIGCTALFYNDEVVASFGYNIYPNRGSGLSSISFIPYLYYYTGPNKLTSKSLGAKRFSISEGDTSTHYTTEFVTISNAGGSYKYIQQTSSNEHLGYNDHENAYIRASWFLGNDGIPRWKFELTGNYYDGVNHTLDYNVNIVRTNGGQSITLTAGSSSVIGLSDSLGESGGLELSVWNARRV